MLPLQLPLLSEVKELKCDSCGSTFDDIINTGRYGCPNCYDTFEDRMDPILKKLQGEKIDILLNNAMDKANYNIRDYNYKNSNKEMQFGPLPNLTRETRNFIKTDIFNKYKSFSNNKKSFDSPIKQKNDLWTQKILDERKIKIYRKIYSLKYLKIDDKLKFKIQFMKNSKNIVQNQKMLIKVNIIF